MANNTIGVTVVIPCLNAEASISTAITSALTQQQVKIQLICVDDGSDDRSLQILTELAKQQTIELIRNPAGPNASQARNLGLQLAQYDYIQFLDADDTLMADKLYRQVKMLEQQQADFIAGAYQYQNFAGHSSVHQPNPDRWQGLLASTLGRTSSNLFRTQALKDIGGWREQQKSSQEYRLMFELLKNAAKLVYDHQVGAKINATEGSISNSNQQANAQRFIALRGQMFDYLQQHRLVTEKRQAVYQQVCESARNGWGK